MAGIHTSLSVLVVAALLGGCATGGMTDSPEPAAATARVGSGDGCCAPRAGCCGPPEVDAVVFRQALSRTAAGFVGRRRIEVEGRRLPFDCSGLARGVYLAHGVDLFDGAEADDSANGVRLIYRHVAARGRLFKSRPPGPGDLVFFHNTYDRNGDGRVNDLLTHVGIVERVEADGTIVFISRVSRGVERYRMNLAHPDTHLTADGRLLNDYMRRKRPDDPGPTRYLSGELFALFGTLGD